MTRHERVATWYMVGLIVMTLFAAFGTEYIGYPKVGGLSMEPTIHQPLYVPFGPPDVRHRGAYVHINLNATPTVGSIVIFQHGADRDIKRVEQIREDALWVTADNVGMTGADSREYGWIPASDLVGVVDRIITPRRLLRSFTADGRWRNWIEFSFSPTTAKPLRSDTEYVALGNGNITTLYHSPSREPIVSLQGILVGWEENNMVTMTTIDGMPTKLSCSIRGEVSKVEPQPPTCIGLACAPGVKPGHALTFDGIVRVMPGDHITFPGRPGVVAKVDHIEYMACGGPGGIATIASLDTPMSVVPATTEPVAVSGR